MKILALDSSGLVASVAVMENDTLVAEYTMNYKKTHSQTLLPMLDEIKNNIQVDLSSIDAIAVAAGPGSFTGLRIGSATAKGLGLALDKPLIAVPTVDALAYNLYDTGEDTVVCPIMDARRNQVYTGIYKFQNHEMAIVKGRIQFCSCSFKPSKGRGSGCLGRYLFCAGKNSDCHRASAGLFTGISGRKGAGRTPCENRKCLKSERCGSRMRQQWHR